MVTTLDTRNGANTVENEKEGESWGGAGLNRVERAGGITLRQVWKVRLDV